MAYQNQSTDQEIQPVLFRDRSFAALRLFVIAVGFTVSLLAWGKYGLAQEHELVIQGGRVIDPETELDGLRNIAIDRGMITAISESPLSGRQVIDARGLVVAPGFIDLHQHAWDEESIRLKALDGVTSILELEVGTADIEQWYGELEGVCRLNHGVSVGHIPVRMQVMGDPPAFLPASGSRAGSVAATPDQIAAMEAELARGLDLGAVAVGFGVAYTPAATDAELVAILKVASTYRASCHMHLRGRGQGAPASAIDAAKLAATAGASLHIVHLQATAGPTTPELLRLVDAWQAEGQDVTAEVYPWTAGMTEIQSAIFADGWQQRMGISFSDLQWGATGERLTDETFRQYREQGGLVIVHNNTTGIVNYAVAHPATMIASDGLAGHPRNAGTYARVLGHYVRQSNQLNLMNALAKMSLLPAQRLENRTAAMRRKGRIQPGCDADLTIFDPETVGEQATYETPELPSQGIVWVFVSGQAVVRLGELVEQARPGRAIRAVSTPSTSISFP